MICGRADGVPVTFPVPSTQQALSRRRRNTVVSPVFFAVMSDLTLPATGDCAAVYSTPLTFS